MSSLSKISKSTLAKLAKTMTAKKVAGGSGSLILDRAVSTINSLGSDSSEPPSYLNSIAKVQARHMSTVLAMSGAIHSHNFMDEYDTIMSSPTPVSCNRLSKINSRVQSVKAQGNFSDVVEAQREWDELLQDSEAHFEYMKEDPYLSDFEEMESDWQRFHCEHDILRGATCDIIQYNFAKKGGDLDVEADCVQTCIH